MSRPDVAIVGGGLFGRCLAWRASLSGARVVLYDSANSRGINSAAWAAAGMIAPTTEAIDADAQIASMGNNSLRLWPRWLSELPIPVFYRDAGTLLLWNREDAGEATRAQSMLVARQAQSCVQSLESSQIARIEPELETRFSQALYVPGEAQVDNRDLLKAVGLALDEAAVECHWETALEDGNLPHSGIVVDCRGMGAKGDFRNLRGVRGEIVRLHAPEIELNHMLRLLHPRYPVYIVPRADGKLVVGATAIESEVARPPPSAGFSSF